MPLAKSVPPTARAVEYGWITTYSVGAVLDTLEVDHAVNTSVVGSLAATAVRIEFLLGQDVTARLLVTTEDWG